MLGTRKNRLAYLAVLVVGVALTLLIANGKPKPQAKPVKAPPVPIVDVLRVAPTENRVWVNSQGTVEPKTRIELVAQVSGRVVAVTENFVAGGLFLANEPLLSIETSDYEIAISQAQAQLADAQQLLATEQGRARQAKREWRDVGSAEANDLFLRKPQLASAKANVAAASGQLAKARLDLARTRISAPFDGRVLSKRADVGQFVTAGAVVGEVYSTDIAEVRLPLNARQRLMLELQGELGTEVRLTSRYGDEAFEWPAVLDRFEGAIDSESRQYVVVAQVANPFIQTRSADGSQRPSLSVGKFVTAEIAGSLVANSFTIPRAALRQEQQIWLLDQQQLRFADVDVIQVNKDQALVKLIDAKQPPGQPLAVVVSPLSLALDGMQVRENNSPAENSAVSDALEPVVQE